MPKALALSYFEPGFSPKINISVFLLTDSLKDPPKDSISFFASFLPMEDNVPVKTHFLPVK